MNKKNDEFIDEVEQNLFDKVGISPVRSERIGKKFESIIQNTCDEYFKLGLAYIQKFYTPSVYIPKENRMIFTQKTGFDFVGAIFAGGQPKPVFIECKSTKAPTIPIGNKSSGIKIHQIELMHRLESLGALTYILWEVRKDYKVYMIKPKVIFNILNSGKKSISIIDMQKKDTPIILPKMIKGKVIYDFLNLLS